MGFVEFHKAKDSYIWDKFRDGNTSAFEIIYERHINFLANYGNRMCSNQEMVKDAIQDLFVDLWRNRSNLGNTESIKFYLAKAYRRNLIKKIVSANKFNQQIDSFESVNYGFELSHEISIIDAEIEEEKLTQLNKSLNKLPPRQKEALFLRFYSGLNYSEISEILEVNPQSAYNLVYRALEILRERMAYKLTTILFFLLHIIC